MTTPQDVRLSLRLSALPTYHIITNLKPSNPAMVMKKKTSAYYLNSMWNLGRGHRPKWDVPPLPLCGDDDDIWMVVGHLRWIYWADNIEIRGLRRALAITSPPLSCPTNNTASATHTNDHYGQTQEVEVCSTFVICQAPSQERGITKFCKKEEKNRQFCATVQHLLFIPVR